MVIRTTARTAAIAVGASLLLAPTSASAADAHDVDGTTAYTAAGSCWEIKQRYPDAGDGRYWIVTPAMNAPQQIYCDQTSDGGGWELIARGRERWTEAGGGTVGSGTWMTDLPIDGHDGIMIAKQLPGSQIDALLNNQRVDSLRDGVRLRRAKNTSGTAWQEIRYSYSNRDRWSWATSAQHEIASYSVYGSTSRVRQDTRDMRLNGGDDINRVWTYAWYGNNFARGFNYGKYGPRGSKSATSYLYSARSDGRYATPFTQMYIRPQLTRADMDFGSIPNSGLKPVTNRPIVSSEAEPNVWGVTGLGAGGKDKDYATEVSAFAQIGNRMYVGGNFTHVRNNATGKEYSQPYLAAFDATTGAWIPSFRPQLNNQVKALAVLNGRLAVGGEFTKVGGRTQRALTVLWPGSGRRYGGFNATLAQSTSGARLWVRALLSNGNHLFVAGSFNLVKGGSRKTFLARYNLVKLRASNGTPYAWAPNLGQGLVQANGKRSSDSSVLDLSLSPDRTTLYAAGRFTQGYVGRDGKAAVSNPGAAAIKIGPAGTTATFRYWRPRYSSALNRSHYQQAVEAVTNKVWLGGSQHSLGTYTASNLRLMQGNITMNGGDFQAITHADGIVYGSCHCNDFNYSTKVMNWDSRRDIAAFQADRIGYIGAWDAVTNEYLPEFAPTSGTRTGDGPWALQVDTRGTLWSGGDYTSVVTTRGKTEWAGGFVRFKRTPTTAPATPAHFEARHNQGSNYAYFKWSTSSTPNVASYELIKDDRVIQVIEPRSGGFQYSATENYTLASYSGRFFVRAVDQYGNRSATTPVVNVGGPPADAARAAPETAPNEMPPSNGTPVPAGSTWLVTAPTTSPVDQDWAAPDYTPSTAWSEAAGPIGWGTSAAESTFDARPGTFYLRRTFTVDDPGALDSMWIRTVADDGAAIYINGVEVGRKNLPNGALTGSTQATATPTGSDSQGWAISVPTSVLVPGRNVVSAEVHPGSSKTQDVLFDLRITVG